MGEPDISDSESMDMYRNPRDAGQAGDAEARTDSSSIVVPSADVLAIVRHRRPPGTAPAALSPYVVRDGADDGDWLLTDDAIAFGPASVVDAFAEWRSTWERVWNLDPAQSLTRLLHLVRELDADGELDATLVRYLDGDGVVVAPQDQPKLRSELARVGDLIRRRDADGYGIIDRTPGVERVGLARAWSSHGAEETVAADEHTTIRFQPDIGLVIATGSGADRVVVAGVDEVRLSGDAYEITGRGRTITIPAAHARPIAWMMPGSTEWRVRRVPEIVAWARTFAGLDEASHYASALGLPMVLTRRPILPHDVDPAAD